VPRIARVVGIGLAAVWTYWIVAAVSTTKGRIAWSRELRIRAVVVVVALLVLRVGAVRAGSLDADPWRAGLGLLRVALALGFARWARLHIGRNGGGPMSRKDDPEVVDRGPYRLVRRPIDAGILLGWLGTTVDLHWFWIVVAVLAGISFVHRGARGGTSSPSRHGSVRAAPGSASSFRPRWVPGTRTRIPGGRGAPLRRRPPCP